VPFRGDTRTAFWWNDGLEREPTSLRTFVGDDRERWTEN
jgi:hypothetical protein